VKLYSCKIRLGGSVVNEVRKDSVTAAEIVLLQVLHGEDAVSEIIEAGEVTRSDAEERERLVAALYDADAVRATFGVAAIPLPKEIAGAGKPEPIVVDEPVVRRRVKAEASPELE
jgi:hypothetical protein